MTAGQPEEVRPGVAWLRKADFVTGIGFVLFGLVAVGASLSLRWDLASVQQAGWYTAPGLVPLGVGVLLAFQGAILTLQSLRRGGRWERGDMDRAVRGAGSRPARRVAVVALLLVVYVFGMVGRLHFTLASFIFLVAFMYMFRAGAWWKILLVSAGAAVAVSYLFEGVARVPLP